MFFLYSLLVSLAVWFCLAPWTLISVLAGSSSWEELRQRLGKHPPAEQKRGPRLLIHGVSAGEVNVAGSILRRFLSGRDDVEVILSTGNRAGKETARRLESFLPQIHSVVYLPWDRRSAMRGWLRAVNPDLVCVVETEIWPNLFDACRRMDIPLYIVNGRLYRDDVDRYRIVRPFIRRVLSSASWIGAQSDREKERFLRIGADPRIVSVAGNAKFEPPDSAGEVDTDIESRCLSLLGNSGPVVLGASSHRPEERWLLEAYRALKRDFPAARLVLAPRHPSRSGEIVRLIRREGFVPRLWSEARHDPLDEEDVLLVDQMGFLTGLHRRADVVFVGGSLAKRGGHNLLEPAREGKPIIVGPHCDNFADIVRRFTECDALIQLRDARELGPALERMLRDPSVRRKYGEAGRRVCLAGEGAARVYAEAMSRVFPVTSGKSGGGSQG